MLEQVPNDQSAMPIMDGGENHQRRFEILMLDYEMAREDERNATSAQTAGFGIAIALLAVMIPLIGQSCHHGKCGQVPAWLIAAAPIAPLGMAGYLVGIGVISTIRSYYIRALEMELEKFAGGNLPGLPIPPGSFIKLSLGIASLRRGRKGFRALVFIIMFGTVAVFGGITLYLVWELPPLPRLAAGAVYLPTTILIISEALNASIGGRGLFADAAHAYVKGRSSFPNFLELARFNERSLISYLLIPRPQDIIKWIFLPASFAMGLVTVDPDAFGRYVEHLSRLFRHGVSRQDLPTLWASCGPLLRLILIFLILEYLIYEARYQWNDIRGLGDDLGHPIPRGRLPVGFRREHVKRSLAASEAVIAARVLVAFLIAWKVGHGLIVWTFTLTVTVWGVAVLYEWLRAQPSIQGQEFRATATVHGIWIIVGAGYAIRGVTGLAIAGFGLANPLTVLAAGALLAFGTLFVTLTWALDATSYFHDDPTCRRANYQPALLQKQHLAALIPYLKGRHGRGFELESLEVRGQYARPLRRRGRIWTPWNISMLISGALGGGLGIGLAYGLFLHTHQDTGHAPFHPSSRMTVLALVGVAVLLGFGASWLPVLARGSLERWISTIAAPAVVSVVLWRSLGVHVFQAVLPWSLFALWFTWFRDQSLCSLKAGIRPMIQQARQIARKIMTFFVSRRTMQIVSESNRHPAPSVADGGEPLDQY